MHSEAVSHAKRAMFTLEREFFIQICEKVGARAPCATRFLRPCREQFDTFIITLWYVLQNVLDKVDTWLAFA